MSLDNLQIHALCTHYKLPMVGIYMRDRLPPKARMGVYVVNMQPAAWNGGGSHWVAALIGSRDTIYFDSFAATPPTDILQFLRSYEPGRQIATNSWIIQDIKSERCGWYCIALAIWCKLHPQPFLADAMNAFVNKFVDDTRQNGGILETMFLRDFGKPHSLVRRVLAKHF